MRCLFLLRSGGVRSHFFWQPEDFGLLGLGFFTTTEKVRESCTWDPFHLQRSKALCSPQDLALRLVTLHKHQCMHWLSPEIKWLVSSRTHPGCASWGQLGCHQLWLLPPSLQSFSSVVADVVLPSLNPLTPCCRARPHPWAGLKESPHLAGSPVISHALN